MDIYNLIIGILIFIFGIFGFFLANQTTRTDNNKGNIFKIYSGSLLAIILGIVMAIHELTKLL